MNTLESKTYFRNRDEIMYKITETVINHNIFISPQEKKLSAN